MLNEIKAAFQGSKADGAMTMIQARAKVISYYTDTKKHIDFNKILDQDHEEVRFAINSFEKVSGMKMLGSGAYSEVYDMGNGKVLKIVKKSDSAYETFIQKVVKTSNNNPFLPIVYFTGVWAGKTVYILEKLSMDSEGSDNKYKDEDIKDHLAAAIRSLRPSRYDGPPNPFTGITDPDLRQLAGILCKLGLTNDLHCGNIMFRGKQIVITDPGC